MNTVSKFIFHRMIYAVLLFFSIVVTYAFTKSYLANNVYNDPEWITRSLGFPWVIFVFTVTFLCVLIYTLSLLVTIQMNVYARSMICPIFAISIATMTIVEIHTKGFSTGLTIGTFVALTALATVAVVRFSRRNPKEIKTESNNEHLSNDKTDNSNRLLQRIGEAAKFIDYSKDFSSAIETLTGVLSDNTIDSCLFVKLETLVFLADIYWDLNQVYKSKEYILLAEQIDLSNVSSDLIEHSLKRLNELKIMMEKEKGQQGRSSVPSGALR